MTCQNCTKRKPKCHSSCEDYAKYKEKQNEIFKAKLAVGYNGDFGRRKGKAISNGIKMFS